MNKICNEIKWAWQRVFRGWDDKAIWSLDNYLAKIIYETVNELDNKQYGLMSGFESPEEQSDIYKAISKGFERYYREQFDLFDENNIEMMEELNNSFDLLKKYFGTLWT